MLIVKIMCANRGNDDHPRHGHQIFSGVKEVDFYEAFRGDEKRPPSQAGVYLIFERESEGTPADVTHIPLDGNVYVMNEAGRTISCFEAGRPTADDVANGSDAAIFETAAAARAVR